MKFYSLEILFRHVFHLKRLSCLEQMFVCVFYRIPSFFAKSFCIQSKLI